MGDEIELISDGDGLAIIGDTAAVERFLSSAGVPSKDLQLHQKLGSALNGGSGVAQAGSQLAASSGRWVKLTEGQPTDRSADELVTLLEWKVVP